jgi:hypothetical protein
MSEDQLFLFGREKQYFIVVARNEAKAKERLEMYLIDHASLPRDGWSFVHILGKVGLGVYTLPGMQLL